jgi:cell division protein FtsN
LKRQIEKGANTEITQKIQEVEQQKREIQQRLALLISEVELRRKTEEDRSTQQASRATINASPSAISSPSTIAPSSLTIRAPVQLRVGDNFIQIFFFAQHAIDVQHALRRIQSQFPKQAKNATVILQADVAARDAFYGIQIGAFETPARAEQACTTLRGPAVQCFVQLSRSVMPPTSLGDAVSVRPPATTPSSPAAAAGVTPCSPDDRKFMPEKGWVSNCR